MQLTTVLELFLLLVIANAAPLLVGILLGEMPVPALLAIPAKLSDAVRGSLFYPAVAMLLFMGVALEKSGIAHDMLRSVHLLTRRLRAGMIVAVLLDGLDEVSRDEYSSVCERIRAFVSGHRECRVIVTSRKAGHLEPFTQVKLQLSRGRDLFIVTQADTLDAYLPLRENLILTGNASYVVVLLDRFVYEEEGANPTLFRLLADTLQRLSEAGDTWLAVRYYEMRLLDYLGFRCAKDI